MKKPSNGTTSDAELLAGIVDANEMYELGSLYIQRDPSEHDHGMALACFTVAAEMGHAMGQNDLGQMLRNGYGCDVDIPAAIEWYEAAARQGEVTASYNLGTIYLHGLGDRLEYALAAKYLEAAAREGHVEACSDLGTLYRFGQGLEQDLVKAATLHLFAAQNDDYVAMGNLRDYHQELVQPALNGNLEASLALHHIYRGGYGAEFDAAITWAWIRWAHDVCLLLDDGSFSGSLCDEVCQDFVEALDSIEHGDRLRGDGYIAQLLDQYDRYVAPDWQPLLECGAEGGSLTLMGRWSPDGWTFRCDRHDMSLVLLGEDSQSVSTSSRVLSDWSSAIDCIGAYSWHLLYPLGVHPEFGERIVAAWKARVEADEINPDAAASKRWLDYCSLSRR